MEHQGDQDSATSGGGKLVKLADLEDDEHEEEKEEKGGNNNTNKNEVFKIEEEVKSQERICIECNKRFSSGKALGGHMSSAHAQKNKGQKNKSCYSKKLMKRKYNSKSGVGYDDFIDEFDDEDVGYYYSESLTGKLGLKKKRFGNICPHCDKDFPSKKSLFGHMRCHPDRPYRGMDPPDCNNNLNDDDINHYSSMFSGVKWEFGEFEEEGGRNQENGTFGNGMMAAAGASSAPPQVVDLAQDLVGRGWYRKGRRGGGYSAPAVEMVENSGNNNEIYYEDSDEDEEESCSDEFLKASHLLMHFHNSGGSKSNLDDEGEVAETMSSAATPMAADGMEVLLDFAMSRKAALGKSEQSFNGENEEVEAAGMMINQLKKNKGKSKLILENGDDDHSSDDTKSDDDEIVRKLYYARKGKGRIVEKKKKKIKYSNNSVKVIIRKEKLSQSSHGHHHVINPCSVAGGAPPPPPPPPPPPGSVAENGDKGFRCTYPSCGKIFATHQALGGHKSSHNKFKMSIHNTIDDEIVPPPVTAMEDNHDDQSPASKGRRIYKKRNKKAVAEVQKVLDFDLNELPQGD